MAEKKKGRYSVTALDYDGLFKADVLDIQVGKGKAIRKLTELVYLCVDNKAVEVKDGGKVMDLQTIRDLDLFDADECAQFMEIGHLISMALDEDAAPKKD